MLRTTRDFAALQGAGKTRSHPLLLVRFVRNDRGQTRFGLSTGKRIGGAVVRNRVRRRLREALRATDPSLRPGWDVLIVARPPAATASFAELSEALVGLLKAGGIVEGTRQDT